MKFLNLLKKFAVIGVFAFIFIWVFVFNWSFMFKKRVIGEVVAAEKVGGAMAVITNTKEGMDPQVFSYSVGIKDMATGEIFTASSEDRQWGAVTNGVCVVAAYFPYPPWQLMSKGATSHNA